MKKWGALIVLSAAQFLMVLDQAVMNVSISQLVEDFDTSVTVIQGVITFYALTMAALMITGGKLGDKFGRRRAFTIGLIIYASGSALTAVSWNVPSLLVGWSILEGIGAALVLPALVALIATTYQGADRAIAYGVIGGVAGAGIAVGPILGGWVTTEFTWRYVFVGEVIVAVAIVLAVGLINGGKEAPSDEPIDWVGAALSAAGLGLVVYGVLQASAWGWITNTDSPVSPFGLSLTPFVVGAGVMVLWTFFRWSERRTERGEAPLFRLGLLQIPPLRTGLQMFLAQNLILMGVFFSIPLYLQVVQGLDALDTGLRMLPVSVTMFIMSFVGAKLSQRFTPRAIVSSGLWILLAAILLMMSTVKPVLEGPAFATAMALLGVGMGLMASQLGNVIQSSVTPRDRSEAGGLQYTAQQLGSAMGTAFIGAVVISALASTFTAQVSDDDRISAEVSQQISVSLNGSIEFIPSEALAESLGETDLPDDEAAAVVEAYEDGQLVALRLGLFFGAGIVIAALVLARKLPDMSFEELAEAVGDSAGVQSC